MRDKIILTTANAREDLYSVTANEFAAVAPNVQLGLLGSYIKAKNIEVSIIDSEAEGLSNTDLINVIDKEEPLLLGLVASGANPSSSTMVMSSIIDFFNRFRTSGSKVKTFIWGPHPTVLPERTLRETGADFVVRGEGFETTVELFHALCKNRSTEKIAGLSYPIRDGEKIRYIHNKDRALIKDLDILPMVAWEAMNPAKYRAHNWHCFDDLQHRSPYAIIWTSFGCPFKCSYCCINNLFGKRIQRFRSIDSVIKEIAILVERYRVRHLKVLDELFVTNARRIEEFCDRLQERGYDLNMWSYARVDTISRRLLKRLKMVGMNWLSYGFETALPEMLKDIKKGCSRDVDAVIKMTQDEGIYICADVMFGLPNDDMDFMKRTYDFLVRYNFEWVNMYPMFAYPGTELYKETDETRPWKTYSLYGYECVPRGTRYLAPQEVLRFRDEAFVNYYSRNEYLSMIEDKFGKDSQGHIMRMVHIPLKRRLLEGK